MTFKQALKGREPILYARVSTREQKNTLKAQLAAGEAWLKEQGITRKFKVFSEQTSGTNPAPPVLLDAIEYATQKPGKAFLIVRDFQRISRNWRYGAKNMVPLFESDIPVVSVLKNSMSSTIMNPQDDDWLIAVFMGIGAQEVDQIKKRTLAGVAASAAAGIVAGTTLQFYEEEALNPYRELHRLLRAGVGQSEASRRLGKSTSWFRKRRDFFDEIQRRGGDELVEDWLDMTDKIRTIFQSLDKKGDGAKQRKAVARMTSGFMKRPFDFEKPTNAQLRNYVKNFKQFKPKRTK